MQTGRGAQTPGPDSGVAPSAPGGDGFSTRVDIVVDNRGVDMGTPAADDLWAKVAAAVRAQLSEATWNTWFQGVHALDCTEETLILGVPSSVAVERIRTSYLGLLADAVQALTGVPHTIELVVDTAPRADADEALAPLPDNTTDVAAERGRTTAPT